MATAASGVVCVVPDWRPDAPDLGRTHLRESALFVQQHGGDFGGDVSRTTLAGWSLGGKTAVGAALDAAALDGWRPRAVVAIAGGYSSADPLTRQVAMDRLAGAGALAEPIPVHLVHGTADVLVDIERSRLLHAALRDRDWPCTLTELDGADHAGVVMTVYDPEARRCQPTDAELVLRAGHQTAQVIARAATSPSGP
jgi:acetyl esterase/lipase